MSWKDTLEERKELVLSTCSKDCEPRAIVVISLGIVDDKLLIGDCMMKTTLKNMRENNKISIFSKDNGEYYCISGTVEIQPSGKYFDLATKKSNPPLPKNVLVIDIKEVFDLDKAEKIL